MCSFTQTVVHSPREILAYSKNKVLLPTRDSRRVFRSLSGFKLTQAIVPAYVSVYEIVNTAARRLPQDLYWKPQPERSVGALPAIDQSQQGSRPHLDAENLVIWRFRFSFHRACMHLELQQAMCGLVSRGSKTRVGTKRMLCILNSSRSHHPGHMLNA